MVCVALAVEVAQVDMVLYDFYYLDHNSNKAYLVSNSVGPQVAQKELIEPLVELDEHPERPDYFEVVDMTHQDCHPNYYYMILLIIKFLFPELNLSILHLSFFNEVCLLQTGYAL